MELELIRELKEALKPPQVQHSSNRGRKLELYENNFTASSTRIIGDPPAPLTDADYQEIGVDVGRVLRPISDPLDLVSNPVISEIYSSTILRTLDKELLTSIQSERRTLCLVMKLLLALLGDDDDQIMPQIKSTLTNLEPFPVPEPYQRVPEVKQDYDQFFAAPNVQVDRNLGLEDEPASILRDKLQLMQQLNMEYVNSLDSIRGHLTTAQRLRRNVLNWCREMSGLDYVKTDLDSQNNNDNAALGEMPVKDLPEEQQPQPQP